MPANSKYLSSRWSRMGKVSAAILAAFILTTSVHLAIGHMMPDKTTLVMTSIWSSWIMWAGLMVYAFTFERAWRVWALYLGLSALFALIIIFL